uniref:Integrase, catalytic region, zinc finger, CCHC-type, peptidase aspartic, catalytic n=1 Tax=Tanacetum cinerariifolium TaxID=118510 RepID=A0A699IXL2_TANCI|nr:integrase, catalytic region, zinc finger, CCHC-type, peptidase aspartic, catalytic [Tanacetum cinerariifolium]
MSNQSEDIQAAGSDTRPLMLDMTNFESWKQRIRLYCKGKNQEEYILQSIDEGSFKMGQRRDEIASGLPRDIYKLINHNTDAKDIWDNVKMLLEGSELTKDDRESQLFDEFEHFGGDRTGFKETMLGVMLLQEMGELYTELEKMLLMQAQENRIDLDEEQLLFLAGGQTNTFDDDVDDGPIMFTANLSSVASVYDEVGPSYDSDTLSEVQNHDNYLDDMNESHEEHEMQNDVQPNDVVDSDTEYTSNSNLISYVQDNKAQLVKSDASSIPSDTIMMVTNDIYEQDAPCVTSNQPNNTVNASLTAELARYKELAEVYEKGLKLN